MEHISCEIAYYCLNSNKICGKGEEKRCAGSDSLHAEMIYAKSLATAMFTFGNAGLEISKAKQKRQQKTHEWNVLWHFVFFFSQWRFERFIYFSFVLVNFKDLVVQVELRSTSKMLNVV